MDNTNTTKKGKQSKCQKMKRPCSFVVMFCFVASIIVMIFLTPWFFGDLHKVGFIFCKDGLYDEDPSQDVFDCKGWF